MKHLRLPVLVSLAFIAWAPFIGEIRSALLAAFPETFLTTVAVAIAVTVVIAVAVALFRIRQQRAFRYGSVAAGVALFVWYVVTFRTGNPSVDVVERFHFIEYGLVAFLFYRAFVKRASEQQHHAVAAIATPSERTDRAGSANAAVLAVLCGFLAGTLEEFVQWAVPGRTGEIRDILLNLYALAAGLLFSAAVVTVPRASSARRHTGRAPALVLFAIVVLTLAAFVHCAHLGFALHDPETGTFRSFFTRDQLLSLQQRRADEWRRNPPRRLKIVGIEDFYMTEAGWRVQERNRAHDRGNFFAAWKENRTLEKYYDPFLDLASFMTGQVHRWPAEQRRNVEAAARDRLHQDYVSPAGESRIFTRIDKRTLWTAVTPIVAVLLLAAARRARTAAS